MTKDDDSLPDSNYPPPSNNYCVQLINELKYYKGYSLSRIAKRCGVSPSTIRNIASGHVKKPRMTLLKKILILHCKIFSGDFNKKDDDGNSGNKK